MLYDSFFLKKTPCSILVEPSDVTMSFYKQTFGADMSDLLITLLAELIMRFTVLQYL